MWFRTFIIFLLSTLLCACATMKSKEEEEEIDRKVKTAKINVQLGIAYLEQHNIQRAKQKLIVALDQAPHIPETWYSMAYFLEATGDKEQANKYYLKSIQLAPHRGDCQNNYGTFLCRTGQYKKSINHFLAAVKDPDYLDVASAYENAGLCALKIPDNRLATTYFKLALLQDPNRSQSLLKLSDLYYHKGNFPAAKQKLEQYLSISPATRQSVMLSARIEKKLEASRHKIGEPLDDENLAPRYKVRVLAMNEKPLPPPMTTDHPLATKIKLRERFLKPMRPPIVQTVPVSTATKKATQTEPAPKQWRGIRKMPKAKKKILVEASSRQKKVSKKPSTPAQVALKPKFKTTPQRIAKKTNQPKKHLVHKKPIHPPVKLAKQPVKKPLSLAKNHKNDQHTVHHQQEV